MKRKLSMLLLAIVLAAGLAPWPMGTGSARAQAATADADIIIDNGQPGYAESADGNWTTSQLQGYNHTTTRYPYSSAPGVYAQWSPTLASEGRYRVSVYKVVHANAEPKAKVDIRHNGKTETTVLNYQTGTSGWVDLGDFDFAAGPDQYVRITQVTQGLPIRADAVRFRKLETIASLTVPADTKSAPVGTEVVVAFDRPMDIRTLTPSNIVLKETASGTVVAATYSVNQNGTAYTMLPAGGLRAQTSYTVEVGETVKNESGTPLYGGFRFDFRTEPDATRRYDFIRPEHFQMRPGTWTYSTSPGSISPKIMIGLPEKDPAAALPARVDIELERGGTYRIWARARDYATNQPGTRFFRVGVDGRLLNEVFGDHGKEGFAWEDAGTVELTAGRHRLELVDTSGFYPRLDGMFVTDDLDFVPPDTLEEALRVDTISKKARAALRYPEWARTDAEPIRTAFIENGDVRVAFYEVPTANGPVIQKETYLRSPSGGAWVKQDDRTDPYGYLLLYTEEQAEKPFNVLDLHYLLINQPNGSTSWLIPTSLETVDAKTVRLTAERDDVRFAATWTIPDGGADPVVTTRLTAKRPGSYSLGMFNAPEKPVADTDFMLLPFQIVSKRLPDEFTLVTEQYASTPLSLVTLPANGERGRASFGVVADPAEIPNRWAYGDNSRFGLSIRGTEGGVLPGLFAPLFGSPEASLSAGQSFEFRYRPVTRPGEWFEAYRHVVTDVFGLTDYRSNVNVSLTEALFNMQELAMDDTFGGWDDKAKAHYNMEGRNVASQGSPLSHLQSYLLTEDPDVYERRTIPTLEYLLTHGSLHFSATGPHGGILDLKGKLSPVGSPVSGFGTSVFGGAYFMTKGQVPLLRQIGMDGGVRHQNAYANDGVPRWHEYLMLYTYTKDSAYLAEAIAGADRYIAERLETPDTRIPAHESFINISYAPYWQGLLDLYEVTKERKYLDAAREGAHRWMTSVWTQPSVASGDVTVRAADLPDRAVMSQSFDGYWRGDAKIRLGYPDNMPLLRDETVPAWQLSRVGLGLEQRSTFSRSGNIMMSNWAPDLMRLSLHTGDPLYEAYARNAIIGRFANYPGYYYNQNMTHPMKADYPYVGPDFTNIYYHHIPAMIGLTVDFLMAQAQKRSDGQIDFPAVREQGYAYFNNKHYGFAPGRLFGESDMWLWMKPGLLSVNSIQADWVAARKDGRFAAALMNESGADIEVEVRLGDEVTGGVPGFGGTATVYDAAGNAGTAIVSDGKLSVVIPARGLIAFAIDAPDVTKPGFADVATDRLVSEPLGGTVAETGPTPEFGRGMVLQLNPAEYVAYVYTQFMPDRIRKAELEWRIGEGEWHKTETEAYPFAFSIRVPDSSRTFSYRVSVTDLAGAVQQSPVRTIAPLDGAPPVTSIEIDGASAPTNGWHSGPVTVALASADRGSGVAQTVYSVNGGDEVPYTAPFVLDSDGEYDIGYYSIDRKGNREERKTVRVRIDRTAPELIVSADPGVLRPPNHKPVPIHVDVRAADSLSGLLDYRLVSIASDEPDDGTGDGGTSDDVGEAEFGSADTDFTLRAERSGRGDGRKYTIVYEARDLAGNVRTAETTVRVPH
ncbi:OmpL47-type beta-barrel domain-containing protein [Paenibacillus flagellatus]|uniref:Uncharacterized protein n=1 Tax=Paenibacillus flagellatus TaxID=2211139 RepID=A0A2V5K4N4_9BACL|nr:Ig-like domain-containing protein [Paenibacillus flagellatus]PYI52854.1 hypothetical protein DLM86_17750 [Paenibacillus flagellatus]